ncbi:MAG: glycosyltransferase involved in cell wall biosynthesis [Polaribacter sp.]|jgi:glycosyltransferase involved in cell wall biosynthesis
MILMVLFYILVAAACIQIIYFLCFSKILSKKKKTANTTIELPISVIICAKNEAHNLTVFLPSILHQEYSNFEIVLINDASTDTTLDVMEQFRSNNSIIKIVTIENTNAFWGNKKQALTLGVKAATHEHLVFTDADCKPASKYWIKEMASQFSTDKTIVLGYGKYKYQKTFVNLLVRYETLLTALQYFTYAKLGSPYMGVGRNLAYTKSAFFKTNGFSSHIQVKSGDDDLFIQEAATKSNTTFTINPDSYTVSNPPLTLKEWFRQKRRHVSTSSSYKFKHQFFLGLFFISKFTFYTLTILLYFLFNWKMITPVVVLYFITFFIVFGISVGKFKEKRLVFFLPFLEIFLILFQFSIFITNTFSKPTHWK